ncbi:hypothetical protein [Cetobacterium sp.]|uniref:hypothetical protein n=1 Tax=Cetobacterium sp. TaxID=2071632 RepID=UPI003F2C6580
MLKNKFYLIVLSYLLNTLSYSNIDKDRPLLPDNLKPNIPIETPLIPLLPSLPSEVENIDEDGNIRYLEKNYTVMVEAKVNIFVPLEIVSDININADVYGDQVVNVPFTLELNKSPEKLNYYKLKYSETELDIDNDGRNDVFIYSPEYINTRYVIDNYIQIHGDKITKEGNYKKTVYVTIEAGI